MDVQTVFHHESSSIFTKSTISVMAQYLDMIDDFLRTPGKIDEIFTLIETKTKIQRKFVGLGVSIVAAMLVLTTLAPLVVNLVAFTYPAFKSIKETV